MQNPRACASWNACKWSIPAASATEGGLRHKRAGGWGVLVHDRVIYPHSNTQAHTPPKMLLGVLSSSWGESFVAFGIHAVLRAIDLTHSPASVLAQWFQHTAAFAEHAFQARLRHERFATDTYLPIELPTSTTTLRQLRPHFLAAILKTLSRQLGLIEPEIPQDPSSPPTSLCDSGGVPCSTLV